jgi:hypothetical protein
MQIFQSGASEYRRVIFKNEPMFGDTEFKQENKIELNFLLIWVF